MSLLDTASLIVTPNGYKEGKLYSVIPSDGSGDLSVVRATTATRVNSAGLVELVPYNLLTYSQDFSNAAWSTSQATLTSGQSGYDGNTNAYKLQATGTNCYVFQGSYDFSRNQSIYAKAGNYSQLSFIVGGYSIGVRFNLTTGTIADNTNTSYFTPTIESVGNGWYRCSVAISSTAPTYGFLFAPNYVAGGNSTSGDYIFVQDAQLVEGSTAKDYQKTETRLNIPRLDYSNGTCPSLLVEPQRTNLLTYSSSFDNAAWNKETGNSITSNTTISPSGIQDADTLTATNGNGMNCYQVTPSVLTGTHTYSAYVKSNGTNLIDFYVFAVGVGFGSRGQINFSAETFTVTLGTGTIENAGNGWYRITLTNTYAAILSCGFLTDSTTGTRSVFVWGAQLEAGNYSTSYIPTTSASVTRNADVISKTGISSLIGQTEGTLFVDTYIDNIEAKTLNVLSYLKGTSVDKYIGISNTGGVSYVDYPAITISSPSFGLTNGRHKFAIAYKTNDFAFYIDGVQVGTASSGVPSACSEFGYHYYASGYDLPLGVNSTALWKTRLTNTQLAQLTTI
jgi:hypothetical protein